MFAQRRVTLSLARYATVLDADGSVVIPLSKLCTLVNSFISESSVRPGQLAEASLMRYRSIERCQVRPGILLILGARLALSLITGIDFDDSQWAQIVEHITAALDNNMYLPSTTSNSSGPVAPVAAACVDDPEEPVADHGEVGQGLDLQVQQHVRGLESTIDSLRAKLRAANQRARRWQVQ